MASTTKAYRLLMELAGRKEISFELAARINAAVSSDIFNATAEGFAAAEQAALKAIRESGRQPISGAEEPSDLQQRKLQWKNI